VKKSIPLSGVYFLGNDAVFDLAVAFLASFRNTNPALQLCLIPFDNNCVRLKSLAEEFSFTIYEDFSVLHGCDAISVRFHGRKAGHYRKLAMWHGPFDTFAYIDIDTVIFQSLSFLERHLLDWDVICGHSDIECSRRFVWKHGEVPGLSAAEVVFAGNTGFVASRKDALRDCLGEKFIQDALALIDWMELSCYEQPLLNFFFLRSGARYTSLNRMVTPAAGAKPDIRKQGDFDRRIPQEAWAGDPNHLFLPDGRSYYQGIETDILFLHWAGQWRDRQSGLLRRDIPFKEIWNRFRLGYSPTIPMAGP
jgi:hypothetical protein